MGKKNCYFSTDFKKKRLNIPQTLRSAGAEKDNGEL